MDFCFVGVSTSSSAVTAVFNSWCTIIGVDWSLQLLDLPLGSPEGTYLDLVSDLKRPSVVGALITSHKAGMYDAGWRGFDLLEPGCFALQEIGVAYRRGDALCGGVSDVASGGLELTDLTSTANWIGGCHKAVIIGGGGAGLAAAWNLCVEGLGGADSVVIVESSLRRQAHIQDVIRSWPVQVRLNVVGEFPRDLARPDEFGAIVINASGVGKDLPGSPIESLDVIPDGSVVWDFNYRGPLDFLSLAAESAERRGFYVRDGFRYFAAGWSTVLCRVAGIEWSAGVFESFLRVASESRRRESPPR